MKYIMKLLSVMVFMITIVQLSAAQDEKVANKLFYAEFGGPGMIMSANVDSRFVSGTKVGLGFRLGAGFGLKRFETPPYYDRVMRTVYAFPAGINYIFGKPNAASAFEVGAGVSVLSRKASYYDYAGIEKEGHVIGFITLMYRLTPVRGGMSFRVGFTPIVGTAGDLYPMGAIGFGYAF